MCADCEVRYEHAEVYDFHHRDPLDKAGGMTSGEHLLGRSWERARRELDKCVLLCANCHRIRHARQPVVRATSPRPFLQAEA